MKKIGLLLILIASFVRAEVLCVFEVQTWNDSTVSSVRSTLNYSGSTWSGLVDTAVAAGDTSYDALNNAYSSLPFDINYAIYFAYSASGCTHTLAGASASGAYSSTFQSTTALTRVRAQSTLTKLLKNKKSTLEGEEDEEDKISISIGLSTYSNDTVSTFDSNVIPIYITYGNFSASYTSSDEQVSYGVGYTESEGDGVNDQLSMYEYAFNYTEINDFLDSYSTVLHVANILPNKRMADLSASMEITAGDATRMDIDAVALAFEPTLMDHLYFEWGVNIGFGLFGDNSVYRGGVLVGIMYLTEYLAFNIDANYFGNYITYDYSSVNAEGIGSAQSQINLSMSYNY